MTKTESCTVRLLNKSYQIKCPDGEMDNLQRAADKLNEQLLQKKKQFKLLDDYQTLLLAALHLSHELITCQNQQEKQRQQVTQFISSLENKINQVVDGSSNQTLQPDETLS